MPLFTVAIPTYNRAEMLAHTISCVLQQTYRDFELVISDNGSPDHTAQAVARFNDPRIRYIRHPENRGPIFNWSYCTDVATGDWLVFNQDDDLLCPIFLERCANAIRKRPDIVMYATECTMSKDTRSLYSTAIENLPLHHRWDQPQPRFIPGHQIAALNFFITGFFPPCQAYPTHLIQKHFPRGPDAELLADRYITWRIACEGTVAYEAMIGALLGDHSDRFSVREAHNETRSVEINACRLLAHFEENGIDWQSALREILPELPARFRYSMVHYNILREGIPRAAFEILAESLAVEAGMSVADYLQKQKTGRLQNEQKAASPIAADPSSVALEMTRTSAPPFVPKGRLDRFGLPAPLIRCIRAFLRLLGKRY